MSPHKYFFHLRNMLLKGILEIQMVEYVSLIVLIGSKYLSIWVHILHLRNMLLKGILEIQMVQYVSLIVLIRSKYLSIWVHIIPLPPNKYVFERNPRNPNGTVCIISNRVNWIKIFIYLSPYKYRNLRKDRSCAYLFWKFYPGGLNGYEGLNERALINFNNFAWTNF